MPFPTRVQPFDPSSAGTALPTPGPGPENLPLVALKPLPHKSRLKRLLERQFRAAPAAAAPHASSIGHLLLLLPDRVPAPTDVKDKDHTEPVGATAAAVSAVSTDRKDENHTEPVGPTAVAAVTPVEPEPSSLCLSRMVQNFLEGNNDRPARCGRRRCSCFNGSTDDSSDDDLVDSCADQHRPPPTDVSEIIKSLVSSTGVSERNLHADVCRIVEKTRIIGSDKDDASRRRTVVVDGLVALGYDASVCKSRWEKSASVPEGEYEYIDVVLDGTTTTTTGDKDRRVLVDTDFRSEFEIARSTKRYRAVLQSLPVVFVGRADRLQQIVAVVSEAARQSLKKRGLHVPPWRKSDYMKAKWLSPYQRLTATTAKPAADTAATSTKLIRGAKDDERTAQIAAGNSTVPDGAGYVGGRNPSASTDADSLLLPLTKLSGRVGFTPPAAAPGRVDVKPAAGSGLAVRVQEMMEAPVIEWQPPAVTPKARTPRGAKVVTGLTSMILADKENVDG